MQEQPPLILISKSGKFFSGSLGAQRSTPFSALYNFRGVTRKKGKHLMKQRPNCHWHPRKEAPNTPGALRILRGATDAGEAESPRVPKRHGGGDRGGEGRMQER